MLLNTKGGINLSEGAKKWISVERELLAFLSRRSVLVRAGAHSQNEQAEPAAAAHTLNVQKELFSGLCSLISGITKYIFDQTEKNLSQHNLPPSPEVQPIC